MQSLEVSVDPGLLWLEITPTCNLRCQHCYAGSSPQLRDPGLVDWLAILKQARDIGYERVQFIGGEPTLHPGLLSLIERAFALGYKFIEVFSNLTRITDSLLETFSHYNVNVATSFYSLQKDAHEKVTGVRGSFDRTINGIMKVARGAIPLRVGVIITQHQASEFRDIVDFLGSLGVDRNRIGKDMVRPMGRGANLSGYVNLEKTLCGNCWQGKMAVSWDGSVFPCVFARGIRVGNVREESLDSIACSPILLEFRKFSYGSWLQRNKAAVSSRESRIAQACKPENPCNPDPCYPDTGTPRRERNRANENSCTPGCYPEGCVPTTGGPKCSPDDICSPGCNPTCSPNYGGKCPPDWGYSQVAVAKKESSGYESTCHPDLPCHPCSPS